LVNAMKDPQNAAVTRDTVAREAFTRPTPTPQFDFDSFAKETGSCTLVPIGGALQTSGSLQKMLESLEHGWEDEGDAGEIEPPNDSGVFFTNTAVPQIAPNARLADLPHRARFVLFHVDGISTVATIRHTLEGVGIDPAETQEILMSLLERGILRARQVGSGIRVTRG
jgi:hypothetical protein